MIKTCDQTRAIILSHISKEAQTMNFFAEKNGSKQLKGESKLLFFKRKWGIYVSLDTFRQLRTALESVLKDLEQESSTMKRFTLMSLLQIYIAHISCLRTLKIKLKDFMNKEEVKAQRELST